MEPAMEKHYLIFKPQYYENSRVKTFISKTRKRVFENILRQLVNQHMSFRCFFTNSSLRYSPYLSVIEKYLDAEQYNRTNG
jgi:hypothetical protein